jgi:hypothetical protein
VKRPDDNSYVHVRGRLVSNLLLIRRLIITVTLAALIACGSVFSYLHLLTKRARFIVETTYQLSAGKQTPTVADIRQRFGSRLQLDECVGSECSYTVTVSNRVLAALRIVPQHGVAILLVDQERSGVGEHAQLHHDGEASPSHREPCAD